MAEFADSLFEQYPLPPPPEAQPSDLLGAFFGQAPDRTGSYAKGLTAGSTYRLQSAQGQKALEEAQLEREHRLKAEMGNELLRKVQSDPTYQPTVSEMLLVSKDANDFTQARGGFQEQGFRQTLGDPNAAPAAQFAAGQGVQGKVLPQTQALGAGREINMLTQTPETNPLGTADIELKGAQTGANDALTSLRNRTDPNIRAGAGGAGGAPRLPVGALKIVDEATQALGAAQESENLANEATSILNTSGVNLGLADNLINRGRNYLGQATPESKAYASIDQTFQKLRNNYLLLAKGVQTEGDAVRAWNSEIGEAAAYDNDLAKQQLEKALTLIDMQRNLQHRRVSNVYANYGATAPGMAAPGAAPVAPGADPGRTPTNNDTDTDGNPIVSYDGGKSWEYP
jgi:hypothetical protein